VNVGPSVVKVVEAAMFVVREPVDLFSCCCPQIEDASGMATANSVEVKFGLVCGENSGWAPRKCDKLCGARRRR
jgi:hypothetical protein